MSDWYEAKQGATSNLATHHGEFWTREDIDLVLAFTDDATDEELAYTTGRTLAAIWAIQHRVRTEGADAVLATFTARRATTRVEHTFDFVTTFPLGWND